MGTQIPPMWQDFKCYTLSNKTSQWINFIELNIYKYAFLKTTEKKWLPSIKKTKRAFAPQLAYQVLYILSQHIYCNREASVGRKCSDPLTPRSSLYSDNCSNHRKTFLALNSYLHKTKLIYLKYSVPNKRPRMRYNWYNNC